MAFARRSTRAAAQFVLSTIAFFSSMPIFRKKSDETSDMRGDPSPTFTEYSSEYGEVALPHNFFLIGLPERDIQGNLRLSVVEALVNERRPASIRSLSSTSVESIEEIDITGVALSADEMEAMRIHQEAEALAEEIQVGRRRKRRFFRRFAPCFGQECFV